MEQKTKDTLTAATIGAGVLGVIGAAVAGVDGMDIDAIEKMLDFDSSYVVDMANKPEELAENIRRLPIEEQIKYTGGYVIENTESESWFSAIADKISNGASALGDSLANLMGADAAGGVVVHIPGTEEVITYTQSEYQAALNAAQSSPNELAILENGINAGDASVKAPSTAISEEDIAKIKESLTKSGGKVSEINAIFADKIPDNLTQATLSDDSVIMYNPDIVKTNAAELSTKLNDVRGDLSVAKTAGIGAVAGAGAGSLLALKDSPSHSTRVRPDGPLTNDWREAMQQQQAAMQNAWADRS